jgi:hypothetical protein
MARGTLCGRLAGSGRAMYMVSICQIYAGKILTLRFKLVEEVDGPTYYFSRISIRLV